MRFTVSVGRCRQTLSAGIPERWSLLSGSGCLPSHDDGGKAGTCFAEVLVPGNVPGCKCTGNRLDGAHAAVQPSQAHHGGGRPAAPLPTAAARPGLRALRARYVLPLSLTIFGFALVYTSATKEPARWLHVLCPLNFMRLRWHQRDLQACSKL